MTAIDIDAIRKLADAATRGPWEAEGEIVQVVGETRYVCDVFGLADKWPTAEFIAAARTLVPALCDELEQTRAALTASRENAADLANENGRLVAENARLRQQRDDTLAELTDAGNEVDLLTVELKRTEAALTDSRKQAANLANEVGALKAELERMRAVVEAAQAWARLCDASGFDAKTARQVEDALYDAVIAYEIDSAEATR